MFGRTPLAWATKGGHKRVVNLLLKRDGVRPGVPDLCGVTALELSALGGYTLNVLGTVHTDTK
ncbi:hypothetical protein HOY80DRAFT_969539 [Tuber brumale]|nr:hypothetical protein HOY80DRAFT_969539 [Tuber brumale]